MKLIQPIFLTEGNTYPLEGMGEENKAYALIDVHERIIRDIADGVTGFLIFFESNPFSSVGELICLSSSVDASVSDTLPG